MAQGDIIVKKVATSKNPAEMLTKLVNLLNFKHCLDLTDIHSI